MMKKFRCECFDHTDGHPNMEDLGGTVEDRLRCQNVERLTVLYRCDMEDHTGTAFCEFCADDAINSGLFG